MLRPSIDPIIQVGKKKERRIRISRRKNNVAEPEPFENR
jgi:hypothetical protein